jgi:hypothetical protein
MRDVAAGRAARHEDGGGAHGRRGEGSPRSFLESMNRFAAADDYVSELRDLLLAQHPSLEGVTKEQFGEQSLVALRRVAGEEPELVRRAEVDSAALARAFEWDALCSSWLPSGVGDADPRIDARVDLLATALIEAVGDPFTRRIRGDHFFNVTKVLESQFPTEVGLFLDPTPTAPMRAAVRHRRLRQAPRAGDRVPRSTESRLRPVAARADEVARPCRLRFRGWVRRARSRSGRRLLRLGVRSCRPTATSAKSRSRSSAASLGGVPFETRRLVRDGARALILDLRGNPGGLIAEAVSIANLFLPPELVVTHILERGEHHELPTEFESTTPAFGPELPLVVLIDRSSASASELLTGALKDHRRALFVGERTFGKGIGQMMRPLLLTRGEGARSGGFPRFDVLWITALRFLPPGEVDFHGVGLVPRLRAAPSRLARAHGRGARLLDDRGFQDPVEPSPRRRRRRCAGPGPSAPLLPAAAPASHPPGSPARGAEGRRAGFSVPPPAPARCRSRPALQRAAAAPRSRCAASLRSERRARRLRGPSPAVTGTRRSPGWRPRPLSRRSRRPEHEMFPFRPGARAEVTHRPLGSKVMIVTGGRSVCRSRRPVSSDWPSGMRTRVSK